MIAALRPWALQGASLLVVGALVSSACTSGDDPSAAPSPPPLAAGVTPIPPAPESGELFVDPEAEPDDGTAPLKVRFRANVEDGVGDVECEWDFGDGSPREKGMEPLHVFTRVEDYEIVARCRDSTGVTGEGEVDVFVEAD